MKHHFTFSFPCDHFNGFLHTSISYDLSMTHVIFTFFFDSLSILSNWGEMDGLVANAFWSIGGSASGLRYPWETGPQSGVFAKRRRLTDVQIFDKEKPQPPEDVPTDLKAGEPFPKGSSVFDLVDGCKPLYATCVKALAVRTYEEDRDNKSKLAIRKWRLILSNNYGASKIGRDIHDEILIGSSDEFIDEMLIDVFGVKSPNTLLKRAGSIMKYLYWHAEQYEDSGFPLEEKAVYQYFKYLEASNAGATTSTSFRESIRFCKHIMGLESADIVLESRLLSGAAQRHFSGKRLLSQAPVLKVADVKELERICCKTTCFMDRYIAGVFLVCIYGRCRWSDIANLNSCDLTDESFIELTTVVHKTSITAVRKTTLLPIAVPTVGLTGSDWFASWKETAEDLHVDFSCVPFGPLMKAPRNGDSFLDRPLTSTEASLWLTGLLKGSSDRTLTSHGLKSTALSWCAKAGLSREIREILGRHSSGVKSTSAIYSRDLQAGPLRRFVTLLKKVRLQIFDPDAGRGGRWPGDLNKDDDSKCGYVPSISTLHSPSTPNFFPKGTAPVSPSLSSWKPPDELADVLEEIDDEMPAAPQEQQMTDRDVHDSDTEDDLSSVEGSSQEDEPEDLEDTARMVSGPEASPHRYPEQLKCFINKRNKVVHRLSSVTFGRFVCGVKVTENYDPLNGTKFFRFPTCGRCLKDVRIHDDSE